ncbi:MAG: hypothetical protein IKJ50_03875 [Clostridia bacterium]|nr:hypothetical protein [Clostridia bacterium]
MTFFEWFYKNLIIEGVFVLILLSGVVFIKFFMPETFLELEELYKQKFTTDTSISEVIDSEF